MKKLFISIPVERHFLHVFSKWRDIHGKIPYLRFVPLKKLHITVLYIGLVEEAMVVDVCDVVREAGVSQQPFGLSFERISYAPPKKPASMVWAYFSNNDVFARLTRSLYLALMHIDIEPQDTYKSDRARTTPHITLARFTDRQTRTLTDLRRTELEGHTHVVQEIQVLESKTTSNGTEYIPFATIPLGGEI